MKIRLVQDKPRYFSTADYFAMVASECGIETEFEGEADLVIYFSQKYKKVLGKKQIAYERDPHRIIFMDIPVDNIFYTQYGNWSDNNVVLHAADPDIHKRIRKPEHDIVFCGRLYEEERLPWLNKLKKAGLDVKVYGDGFTPREYINNLNDGRIILNFSEMGEINRRIFEAMAIGCCVTDRVEHIEKVGEEGKHLFTFDRDDILGTIKLLYNLCGDRKLTDKVTLESRKHIIKNHTYIDRFHEIIKKGMR